MSKSKVLKGLSLFSFVSLIAIFLIYRGGYLDTYIFHEDGVMQTSPNGGALNQQSKDSVKINKTDSLPRTRMSSSKSFVMIDDLKFAKDTPVKNTEPATIQKDEEELEMMGSSKSGIIFKPKPATDTTKRKADKNKK